MEMVEGMWQIDQEIGGAAGAVLYDALMLNIVGK